MKVKKLTAEDITVTLTAEPEDIPVRGNAMASGDDRHDKRVEDQIIADLESGNEWAWCCAKVTGTYMGLRATAYLGACSYKNAEDFRRDGYYTDLVNDCLRDLQQQLNDLIRRNTTK